MKKMSSILMILVLVLALATVVGASGFKGLEVVATKVANPPTIDGDLSDQAWLEAALMGSKVSGFTTHVADAVAVDQSIVYAAYDDEYLYVAWENYTPNIDFLVADVLVDDGPMWDDDDAEVYLNPHYPDPDVMWYQYITNPAGAKFDFKNNEEREFWNSGWEAAVQVGDISWTVEMKIPFAPMEVIPEEGDIWGVNFTGRRVFADQWVSWTTTEGMFAQIERFGRLVFGSEYQAW